MFITRTIAKLVETQAVDGELSVSAKKAIAARVIDLVDQTDTPFLHDGWSDPFLKQIIPVCVEQAAEQLIEHVRAADSAAAAANNPASADYYDYSSLPRLWPCIFTSCAKRTSGPP